MTEDLSAVVLAEPPSHHHAAHTFRLYRRQGAALFISVLYKNFVLKGQKHDIQYTLFEHFSPI